MLLPANGELEARASFAVFVFMALRDDGAVADCGAREFSSISLRKD
ncbi:hypothetical protein [Nitrosomonas oligotropha]|nr:hypothetical protein [Nitrosomonas oligotropha]